MPSTLQSAGCNWHRVTVECHLQQQGHRGKDLTPSLPRGRTNWWRGRREGSGGEDCSWVEFSANPCFSLSLSRFNIWGRGCHPKNNYFKENTHNRIKKDFTFESPETHPDPPEFHSFGFIVPDLLPTWGSTSLLLSPKCFRISEW